MPPDTSEGNGREEMPREDLQGVHEYRLWVSTNLKSNKSFAFPRCTSPAVFGVLFPQIGKWFTTIDAQFSLGFRGS